MRYEYLGLFFFLCVGCKQLKDDGPVDTNDSGSPVVIELLTAEFEESGPVACADPTARDELYFDVHYFDADNPELTEIASQAVATVDVDGDGWLDLVYPSTGSLYLNDHASGFVQATDRFPAVADQREISAVSAADYDGDGDFDLLVSFFLKPNQLWRNKGDGYFEDVSVEAGIKLYDYRSQSSAWADFDRDGDLDVYIANYGLIVEFEDESEWAGFGPAHPNEFYVNNGDGTFTEASSTLPGESHFGYGFQVSWNDLDGDGWLDLYLLNDFGTAYPNTILWNREGVLEQGPDGNPTGLEIAQTSMGIAVGDLNKDEQTDFLVTAWAGQSLLISHEDVWVDYTVPSNIRYEQWVSEVGWGSWFADFDLDGLEDVVLLYGYFCCWTNPVEQPDALWLQKVGLKFENVAAEWGVDDNAASKGLSVADINKDGWPDIAVGVVSQMHHARISRCGVSSWLRISVEQPGMNRHGIGARVRVVAGDTVWTEWIRSGGEGFASGGPPEVMFGLGQLEQVDSVEVFWPDGRVSKAETVTTRQAIHVVRESAPYQLDE